MLSDYDEARARLLAAVEARDKLEAEAALAEMRAAIGNPTAAEMADLAAELEAATALDAWRLAAETEVYLAMKTWGPG